MKNRFKAFPVQSALAQFGLVALLCLTAVNSIMAQVTFTDVGRDRGINGYSMAVGPIGGIAAADYDNDGDIDLFLPTGEGYADLLYENDGFGNFTDIAATAGLASMNNHRVALWFDFNGDQRLDLAVAGDCRQVPLNNVACPGIENLRLYQQQQDGSFIDVTVGSGLEATWASSGVMHRTGLIAGDVDNDGYLDLYVHDWKGRAWLFHNNHDGTFMDITAASGISLEVHEHHQPIMYDFNQDGWLDIYVAVDFHVGNFLWMNQGNGQFVDQAAAAGLDNAMTDMGITLGDYDNDLDMDMYITNITQLEEHNVFFRNDSTPGNLSFSEISNTLNVWQGYWGWGTTFMDADNDGWLDLAATNGKTTGQWQTDESRFWLNQGGNPVTFTDVASTVGFNDTFIASGLIALDFDRDGDLDLVQAAQDLGNLQLLENTQDLEAEANHFLVVRPRMSGPNHFAIGAEITITAGSQKMMRVIRTGTSTASQEPAEAFFGLGSQDTVERVQIKWPDGTESEYTNIAVDQVVTLESEHVFKINAGLNDAWFDPSTAGQGFFVNVFPDIKKIFVGWFTYDMVRPDGSVSAQLGGPGQRWLTAFGSYADNQAVLDIEMTHGGIFDQGLPVPQQQSSGEIVLQFTGCNAATVSYNIPSASLSGVIPIQRIALDNVARCEQGTASSR